MADVVTTTTIQRVETPFAPLSWSALEFEEKDRHPDWIWYTGLIFAIAATLSFFYGNIFFGIFLVISGILSIMFALHSPKTLTIEIAEKAIIVSGEMIEYARVRKFWIDETENPAKLLLLVRGSFVPMLAFTLSGVTAEAVRTSMLSRGVPESYLRESIGIKVAERLGF